MEQEVKKAPVAATVFSIISLVLSAGSMLCALWLFYMVNYMPKSGNGDSLTWGVVGFVSGAVLLIAAIWCGALTGGFIGLIMFIISLVNKLYSIIWMPILAIILGTVAIIICCAVL